LEISFFSSSVVFGDLAMDPVTVPLAGALLATGVIGGGALIESTEHLHPHYWDWDGARNDVKRDLSGRPYDSFSGRLTVDDDYRLRMLEREGFRPRRGAGVRWREGDVLARLGLRLSNRAPFVVEEVQTLMDPHGWKHWEQRYTNPPVRVGDKLSAIDGAATAGLDLAHIHSRLGTLPYSVRTLTFQRANRGYLRFDVGGAAEVYHVKLVRHVEGKRPPWTRPHYVSPPYPQHPAQAPRSPYLSAERAHKRTIVHGNPPRPDAPGNTGGYTSNAAPVRSPSPSTGLRHSLSPYDVYGTLAVSAEHGHPTELSM
jgi:hypothetical protein